MGVTGMRVGVNFFLDKVDNKKGSERLEEWTFEWFGSLDGSQEN